MRFAFLFGFFEGLQIVSFDLVILKDLQVPLDRFAGCSSTMREAWVQATQRWRIAVVVAVARTSRSWDTIQKLSWEVEFL